VSAPPSSSSNPGYLQDSVNFIVSSRSSTKVAKMGHPQAGLVGGH